MIFVSGILISSGISFVSGSIIGMIIGNQVARRNIKKQQEQEFEFWIGSFEDEGSESDYGITKTTPFETINIKSNHKGFPTVPIRKHKGFPIVKTKR